MSLATEKRNLHKCSARYQINNSIFGVLSQISVLCFYYVLKLCACSPKSVDTYNMYLIIFVVTIILVHFRLVNGKYPISKYHENTVLL